MKKLAVIVSVVLAALAYLAWPGGEAPQPIDTNETPANPSPVERDSDIEPSRSQVLRNQLPGELLPPSSADLAEEKPIEEPAEANLPLVYTGPRDERLPVIYERTSQGIEHDRKRSEELVYSFTREELEREAWTSAVNQLMDQNRFYYRGPQEWRRPHGSDTDRVRYISSGSQGLVMIWELTRAEFPEAFKYRPHKTAWNERVENLLNGK